MNASGQGIPVEDAHLVGNRLGFTVKDTINGQGVVMRFYGAIDRNTIQGNVEVQGGPFSGNRPWTARRRP
ncbi:MAG: hypothetical protein A2170_07360 [Deltaproteobacteria bacterium RBG_13_53_10]|nr:MAG: hypothetical protein A2170_07360 [Deltaproteobacteria bacterium RBG_13_53_10]